MVGVFRWKGRPLRGYALGLAVLAAVDIAVTPWVGYDQMWGELIVFVSLLTCWLWVAGWLVQRQWLRCRSFRLRLVVLAGPVFLVALVVAYLWDAWVVVAAAFVGLGIGEVVLRMRKRAHAT